MIAVPDKKCPDEIFRRVEVAVAEQRSRPNDILWQMPQRGHMIGRRDGIPGIARKPVKLFQHAPAEGQSGIEVDSKQQRLDRGCRVLSRDMAQAAFLKRRLYRG